LYGLTTVLRIQSSNFCEAGLNTLMKCGFAAWITGRQPSRLPAPDEIEPYWSTIFAPLALLSHSVTNSDAYWRRLQRIISHIDNDCELPCPFSRTAQFATALMRIIPRLDPHSVTQIVRCLERMPRANEAPVLLWALPATLSSPLLFVRLLGAIHHTNHWLWTGFLNSDSGPDIVLDRLLPYVEGTRARPGNAQLDARLTCVDICADLFVDHPPEDDRFAESFESFFRRLLAIMASTEPMALAVHGFRGGMRLLAAAKCRLHSEQYASACATFVGTCASNPPLKSMVMRVMHSNVFCDLSFGNIARGLVGKGLDSNDIWLMALSASQAHSRTNEKPFSLLQTITNLAVTNEVMARTCCKALPVLIMLFDGSIPWLATFIRKATGFVVIAQYRRECEKEVALVIELFTALYRLHIDWITSEIASAAALLLASHRVSIAMMIALKPALRYDADVLREWEAIAAQQSTMPLTSMLSSVEESIPRVPQSRVKPAPRRPSVKVVSFALDHSPRSAAIIRTRNAKRALVKPNRLGRG
jgi:hypothetical protein